MRVLNEFVVKREGPGGALICPVTTHGYIDHGLGFSNFLLPVRTSWEVLYLLFHACPPVRIQTPALSCDIPLQRTVKPVVNM